MKVWGATLALLLLFVPAVWAAPQVSIITSPAEVTALEAFEITASASALTPGAAYFTKVRIGSSATSLTKGQTFNSANDPPDDWLSDTDAYALFPQFIADAQGIWQGAATARAGDAVVVGENIIVLRMRRTDASTNYDSQEISLYVDPTPTPTQSPTPTPSPRPTGGLTATNTPTTTPTNTLAPTKTPTPLPTPTPTQGETWEATQEDELEEEIVLGEATAAASPAAQTRPKTLAIVFALVGLGLGILSGVFAYLKKDAILFS